MTVSRDEVEELIAELDGVADDIIINTQSFFSIVETSKDIHTPVGEPEHKWKTPSAEEKQLQREVLEYYQDWYASARVLVSEYHRRDLEEFDQLRETFKAYLTLNVPAPESTDEAYSSAHDAFAIQQGMLKAIPRKIEAERLKLKEHISKSVAKDEVQRARDLLDEGLTRASGVTAGVALERHLLTMCEESESELDFQHDNGIASLAQTLYNAGEIEQTTLSSLETLGSIRNDCAHANSQEPNKHKVRRLIEDTDDYIRGRGL